MAESDYIINKNYYMYFTIFILKWCSDFNIYKENLQCKQLGYSNMLYIYRDWKLVYSPCLYSSNLIMACEIKWNVS